MKELTHEEERAYEAWKSTLDDEDKMECALILEGFEKHIKNLNSNDEKTSIRRDMMKIFAAKHFSISPRSGLCDLFGIYWDGFREGMETVTKIFLSTDGDN